VTVDHCRRAETPAAKACSGSIKAIEAVDSFRPLTSTQMGALLAKIKEVAMYGKFGPFKTTAIFDGTARNPQWMGESPCTEKLLLSPTNS
jgi:hypothetical protein